MGYKLLAICDYCGKTDEMSTGPEDIRSIMAIFDVRIQQAKAAGANLRDYFVLKCPECAKTQPIAANGIEVGPDGVALGPEVRKKREN